MRKMISLCFRERGKTGRETEWKESEKNGEEEKSRGVGWWVLVKEMEGGTCRNLIGFGGFVERERR